MMKIVTKSRQVDVEIVECFLYNCKEKKESSVNLTKPGILTGRREPFAGLLRLAIRINENE